MASPVEVLSVNEASSTTTTPHKQPPIGLPEEKALKDPSLTTTTQPTVYDLAKPSEYLGPHGRCIPVKNAQNLTLMSYFWPAQHNNPKAVLVFVHGHGCHLQFELLKGQGLGNALSYQGSWVEKLNQAGISVAGIDNQGCGRSQGLQGLRFYVESFDDYVNDVLQLVEDKITAKGQAINDNNNKCFQENDLETFLKRGFKNLPVFISGISLGGCIAFTAANTKPELFKGVILLAPMLSLERVSRQGLNAYMRPVAALLSRLVPTAAVVATDRNTLYPDIQAIWDADPLVSHGKTRVRNANEYLRATEVAMASLDNVNFPFLVFHSENDTMCDPDGSKQLYLRAKSEDKTLRLVNGMWHVLVKETGNEKILAEMIAWIEQRASR